MARRVDACRYRVCALSSWLSSVLLLVGGLAYLKTSSNMQVKSYLDLYHNPEPQRINLRHKRDIPVAYPPRGGAVYTHWGRPDCPLGAEFVYKGIVAGTHSTHTGGGSEYICVSDKPQWGEFRETGDAQSYIYGAEFITAYSDAFFKHDDSEKVLHHDATCAVCRSKTRISQVMIPGQLTCPKDWTEEYHGYLMSAIYNSKGSASFICVDETPKVDTRSSVKQGGADLSHVEATCGSMPCPNYIPHRELTCVVCTK